MEMSTSETRDATHLSLERVDDELQRVRLYALDALLDNVIPVLILDALQHVAVQLADNLLLVLGRDGLQSFLDHTAAVHLQGQGQHVASHLLNTQRQLSHITSQSFLEYAAAFWMYG